MNRHGVEILLLDIALLLGLALILAQVLGILPPILPRVA